MVKRNLNFFLQNLKKITIGKRPICSYFELKKKKKAALLNLIVFPATKPLQFKKTVKQNPKAKQKITQDCLKNIPQNPGRR